MLKRNPSQDADHRGIEANLLAEAKKATHLMIWTDCDREGEFIGAMVAKVCRRAKPNIVVKRARFSAIIPAYALPLIIQRDLCAKADIAYIRRL